MKPSIVSRRDFLKAGAATAALAASASLPGTRGLRAAEMNYGARRIPWAVQLYTVGGAFRQDPEGTLDHLASLGLKGVEFAGFPQGRSAAEVRRMLDNAGLQAVGAHIGLGDLLGDALPATIEFHQTIGNSRVGISSTSPAAARGGGGRGGAAALIPGLSPEQINATGMTEALTRANDAITASRNALNAATFGGTASEISARVNELAAAELALANARADTLARIQSGPNRLSTDELQNLASGGRGGRGGRGNAGPAATRADWEFVADVFNGIAARLKPVNMRTYYHCHPGDFTRVDGETTWDIFFSRAVPDVFMQADLGHMGTADINQVEVMRKFPGRANTVHVKPSQGGGGKLVGDLTDNNNWPAIFAACEDPAVGGTEWYILEYDGGSMDQVERTMTRLREWGKV
jgi:sugar phosphate isomerase/epimerase